MTQLAYHRFTITVPDNMAEQIEQVCTQEGRNRSELFREAFRLYFSSGQTTRNAQAVTPERKENQFRLFWPEFGSKSDQVYDRLAVESEKDRLLEQWAQMVEIETGFEDVRAVSSMVDAVAGESLL